MAGRPAPLASRAWCALPELLCAPVLTVHHSLSAPARACRHAILISPEAEAELGEQTYRQASWGRTAGQGTWSGGWPASHADGRLPPTLAPRARLRALARLARCPPPPTRRCLVRRARRASCCHPTTGRCRRCSAWACALRRCGVRCRGGDPASACGGQARVECSRPPALACWGSQPVPPACLSAAALLPCCPATIFHPSGGHRRPRRRVSGPPQGPEVGVLGDQQPAGTVLLGFWGSGG